MINPSDVALDKPKCNLPLFARQFNGNYKDDHTITKKTLLTTSFGLTYWWGPSVISFHLVGNCSLFFSARHVGRRDQVKN
jgi:hypothetical protein